MASLRFRRGHRCRVPSPLAAPTLALVLLGPLLSGCIVPIPDRHGARALESGQFLVGAWLGSWPSDDNPAIHGFEKEIGVPLDLVDVYLDWQTPFANVTHTLRNIASHGSVPIVTWEAQTLTTADIIAGTRRLPLRDGRSVSLDAYLDEFAQGTCDVARQTGQPVLLRVLHEMNGFWFSWGISWSDAHGNRPNTPEAYRAAWIKIHDAFTGRCGDAVRFVWAVNHFSLGTGASFMGAYPGDAYVDFVGIDGYNWGTNTKWGWQGFDTLFRPGYCAVTAATSKPMLIDEIASTEKGGDKAGWIRDMYARMENYTRIRGFVWFNYAKYEVEIHGTMDWQVDSSPKALAAFSAGAQALEQRTGSPTPGTGGVAC
jgi:endoglucanase